MQEADLILLDEPFSALDAISRHQLQDLAFELLEDKSVLLVTHDPQEALRLSQRILCCVRLNLIKQHCRR